MRLPNRPDYWPRPLPTAGEGGYWDEGEWVHAVNSNGNSIWIPGSEAEARSLFDTLVMDREAVASCGVLGINASVFYVVEWGPRFWGFYTKAWFHSVNGRFTEVNTIELEDRPGCFGWFDEDFCDPCAGFDPFFPPNTYEPGGATVTGATFLANSASGDSASMMIVTDAVKSQWLNGGHGNIPAGIPGVPSGAVSPSTHTTAHFWYDPNNRRDFGLGWFGAYTASVFAGTNEFYGPLRQLVGGTFQAWRFPPSWVDGLGALTVTFDRPTIGGNPVPIYDPSDGQQWSLAYYKFRIELWAECGGGQGSNVIGPNGNGRPTGLARIVVPGSADATNLTSSELMSGISPDDEGARKLFLSDGDSDPDNDPYIPWRLIDGGLFEGYLLATDTQLTRNVLEFAATDTIIPPGTGNWCIGARIVLTPVFAIDNGDPECVHYEDGPLTFVQTVCSSEAPSDIYDRYWAFDPEQEPFNYSTAPWDTHFFNSRATDPNTAPNRVRNLTLSDVSDANPFMVKAFATWLEPETPPSVDSYHIHTVFTPDPNSIGIVGPQYVTDVDVAADVFDVTIEIPRGLLAVRSGTAVITVTAINSHGTSGPVTKLVHLGGEPNPPGGGAGNMGDNGGGMEDNAGGMSDAAT